MGDHLREQEDFASKHGATRRSVLKGVLAGAAAGAAGVPAIAAATGEIPQSFGPLDVARYYAGRLCEAMAAAQPGRRYSSHFHKEYAFIMVVGTDGENGR